MSHVPSQMVPGARAPQPSQSYMHGPKGRLQDLHFAQTWSPEWLTQPGLLVGCALHSPHSKVRTDSSKPATSAGTGGTALKSPGWSEHGRANSSAEGARGGASRRYGRCSRGTQHPVGVRTTDCEPECMSRAEKPKQPMYSVDHRAISNGSQTRISHTV